MKLTTKSDIWLINKELAFNIGLKPAGLYALYQEFLENGEGTISNNVITEQLAFSAFETRKAKSKLIETGYIKVKRGQYNIDYVTILK